MSHINDQTLQNRRSNRSNGRNITTTTASPPAPQYSYIVTLPTKTPSSNESINADPSRNYSMVLSEIITTLDPATHKKILQQTTLSIEDLIKPKGKFRNGVPPRPQNPWVIYRKDLQAKLVAEQGAEIEFGARVGSISRMASEKWNNEPQEVKQVYEIIAEVAKRVHEQMFPNYKYKPRRKGNNANFSRRSSSASDTSLEGLKRNFGDFKSNTSTFQIERPERRKLRELGMAEDTKNLQKNNIINVSLDSATSKKPYPSPPLTADPRSETPLAIAASSSSSSQSCLDQLSTRHDVSDSLTASRVYSYHPNQITSSTPSWTNPVDGPQQNIIPSWTLYDTTRISPANIFTNVTSPQLSSTSNESTIYNYTQSQQYPNPLLEISPSLSCMVAYDRSLTRLFGGP